MTRKPIRNTATPQELDIFDKLTEDEIVVLFFLVVFLLILVIIMTLVQCRRLKATMVKRRQFKQQQEWRAVSARLGGGGTRTGSRTTTTMATTNPAQELRYTHASSRNMNQQSFHTLQSEIQGLRHIQENVHSQVFTLERYVALKTGDSTVTATARTRTPNESSAGSSFRDTQAIHPDETSASLGPRRRHAANP